MRERLIDESVGAEFPQSFKFQVELGHFGRLHSTIRSRDRDRGGQILSVSRGEIDMGKGGRAV